MLTISATEFKAKCLSIFDSIARTGEGITILKRGHPVAQVLPVSAGEARYPQDTLRGTGRILGDIMGSAAPPEDWEHDLPNIESGAPVVRDAETERPGAKRRRSRGSGFANPSRPGDRGPRPGKSARRSGQRNERARR